VQSSIRRGWSTCTRSGGNMARRELREALEVQRTADDEI
jgi:hypothetical protein